MGEALPFVFRLARIPGWENHPYNPHRVCRALTTSSPPFFLRDSRASETRARVKCALALLSLRKNGGLLVVQPSQIDMQTMPTIRYESGEISSAGKALNYRAEGRGFDSRGRTNTQGLRIFEN